MRNNIKYMAPLAISLTPAKQKFILELNAHQFERLAANFGFFSDSFIRSLEQAEKDYRAGRVKKISSLRDLRK